MTRGTLRAASRAGLAIIVAGAAASIAVTARYTGLHLWPLIAADAILAATACAGLVMTRRG